MCIYDLSIYQESIILNCDNFKPKQANKTIVGEQKKVPL